MQPSSLRVFTDAAPDMTDYSTSPVQPTLPTTIKTARSLGPILDGLSLQHSAAQSNLTTEHTPATLGAGQSGPVDSTADRRLSAANSALLTAVRR